MSFKCIMALVLTAASLQAQTINSNIAWAFWSLEGAQGKAIVTAGAYRYITESSYVAIRGSGLADDPTIPGRAWSSVVPAASNYQSAYNLSSYISVTLAPQPGYELTATYVTFLGYASTPGIQIVLYDSYRGFDSNAEIFPQTIESVSDRNPDAVNFTLEQPFTTSSREFRLYFIAPNGGTVSFGASSPSSADNIGLRIYTQTRAIPEANAATYLIAAGVVWVGIVIFRARRKFVLH